MNGNVIVMGDDFEMNQCKNKCNQFDSLTSKKIVRAATCMQLVFCPTFPPTARLAVMAEEIQGILEPRILCIVANIWLLGIRFSKAFDLHV